VRPIALALATSVALHAAAYAAVSQPRLETKPTPVVRVPAAIDVEVTGGVASESRAVAPFEPARRPQIRRGLYRTNAISTATVTPTPTSNPTSMPTPTPTPTPSPPPPAGEGKGGGSPIADLDLAAFFGRLERAAQRCSGPRSGEGKIRFCVGANGAPIDVALVQSTGNFALDDAALHCVIPGAAPFPRTDRCLVVPLAFH